MNQVEAREAIYRKFRDEWDESVAAPSFDNQSFVPPEKARWVRLAVRNQASRQKTLGPPMRRVRRVGSIFVQIFTPRDEGLLGSDEIGLAVRAVFEMQDVGPGVKCLATSIRDIGQDPSGGPWYLAVAETPFDFDEQV